MMIFFYTKIFFFRSKLKGINLSWKTKNSSQEDLK